MTAAPLRSRWRTTIMYAEASYDVRDSAAIEPDGAAAEHLELWRFAGRSGADILELRVVAVHREAAA